MYDLWTAVCHGEPRGISGASGLAFPTEQTRNGGVQDVEIPQVVLFSTRKHIHFPSLLSPCLRQHLADGTLITVCIWKIVKMIIKHELSKKCFVILKQKKEINEGCWDALVFLNIILELIAFYRQF